MKEKVGEVFSIEKENSPVPGCTIFKEVHSGENYRGYRALTHVPEASFYLNIFYIDISRKYDMI